MSKISQIPLSDVFTPGGLPSITYVSRDHLELEKELSDAIARGFAFIVVTGPTKSGKTVLCRRVLERDPLIVVEGGQIRTEADFWSNITHQLSIAAQTTRSRGETAGTSVTGEAGGSLAGFFQAKTGLAQADTIQSTSTFSFTNISVLAALDRLKQGKSRSAECSRWARYAKRTFAGPVGSGELRTAPIAVNNALNLLPPSKHSPDVPAPARRRTFPANAGWQRRVFRAVPTEFHAALAMVGTLRFAILRRHSRTNFGQGTSPPIMAAGPQLAMRKASQSAFDAGPKAV